MKNFLFIVFLLLSFHSCGKSPKEDLAGPVSDTLIMREYHSNGILKTEISAVGTLRQGYTKNYDRQGRLLSMVKYVNNLKEGTAVNYYAATGKVNSTLEYKNGVKNGDEKWFYESGKVYRVSPYAGGVIEGIQKLYYENGNVMAEIPYKDGYPGTGLKEYKADGSLITDYPVLVLKKEDHLMDANKILIVIMLSNNAGNVKYYRGELTEGKFLNKKLLTLATQDGITQIDFNIPPGTMMKHSVIITANYKTPMGNPLILKKNYSFQAAN